MTIPVSMIVSEAFCTLRSSTAIRVYLMLASSGSEPQTFTYRDAQALLGASTGGFRNAIDELIERGFIDLVHAGSAVHRDASQYILSDRWRHYGTPQFQLAQRPKQVRPFGFQKKHGNL